MKNMVTVYEPPSDLAFMGKNKGFTAEMVEEIENVTLNRPLLLKTLQSANQLKI